VTDVRWSARAVADFESILKTESELGSVPQKTYSERIVDAIEQLRAFPFSGSHSEFLQVRVFAIPRTPYTIYYRPVEFEVELVTIRHGAQEPVVHF
jgi:plasmid stabilization system protein ParE